MMDQDIKSKLGDALREFKDEKNIKNEDQQKTTASNPVISIYANRNAQVNVAGRDVIHNHFVPQKRITNKISPTDIHITQETAKKLRERIGKLVEMGLASGAFQTEKQGFSRWYKELNDHFGVTSYLLIPREQGDQALRWLNQRKALKRPSIRRPANDMWRRDLYPGIWARAKETGRSKSDVYKLAEELTGKRVISLKNLGERNLKKLYPKSRGSDTMTPASGQKRYIVTRKVVDSSRNLATRRAKAL